MTTSRLVFEISIPTTKKVRRHTEYQFILISNLPDLKNTYTRTYKRYSEVLSLHQKIRKTLPMLPDFPRKTWFGRMSPAVVEERRRKFEEYFLFVLDFIIKNNLREQECSREIFNFFNK